MAELTPSPFQYEVELQQWLARNAEALEAGLWIVGYEFPLGGNRVDLLGVDRGGRLVVIEVKRANATREAVGQVLDYVSALESMDLAAIVASINSVELRAEFSPVVDFEREYEERYGRELTELLPARALLACTSELPETERILRYLRDLGVDIDSVVFEGALMESGERTYRRKPRQSVVRSHEDREPCRSPTQRSGTGTRRKIEKIHERAAGYPGADLFRSIHCLFVDTFPEAHEVPRGERDPKRQICCGIAFAMPATSEDWEHGRVEYLVIRLYPVGAGVIEIFVYDRAEWRGGDTAGLLDTLPERPLYLGKDPREGVNGRNFWFTEETWARHQADFEAVIRAIHDGWQTEYLADAS